ncbi:phosphotransferase, partial [Enterococcus avium]
MKLENKNLIVKRAYKEVYKTEAGIVKIFEKTHPKADVFNEALNTARVEAAGLRIPGVKEVTQIDGKWALLVEYQPGKTLEELMEEHPENLDAYMEEFVDLQLEMHGKTSPHLNKLKDKL